MVIYHTINEILAHSKLLNTILAPESDNVNTYCSENFPLPEIMVKDNDQQDCFKDNNSTISFEEENWEQDSNKISNFGTDGFIREEIENNVVANNMSTALENLVIEIEKVMAETSADVVSFPPPTPIPSRRANIKTSNKSLFPPPPMSGIERMSTLKTSNTKKRPSYTKKRSSYTKKCPSYTKKSATQ